VGKLGFTCLATISPLDPMVTKNSIPVVVPHLEVLECDLCMVQLGSQGGICAIQLGPTKQRALQGRDTIEQCQLRGSDVM
jgi:hypothetical protein